MPEVAGLPFLWFHSLPAKPVATESGAVDCMPIAWAGWLALPRLPRLTPIRSLWSRRRFSSNASTETQARSPALLPAELPTKEEEALAVWKDLPRNSDIQPQPSRSAQSSAARLPRLLRPNPSSFQRSSPPDACALANGLLPKARTTE